MILPAQRIKAIKPPVVHPFSERAIANGMSYGLGPAGYDVRVWEEVELPPGGFTLASTIERFAMPNDVLATVHDKSTWARRGVAVQTTVIEPGWRGYLTIEISNHSANAVFIPSGSPIAQILFHRLEEETDRPYAGKYQDQAAGPQQAIYEKPE